MEYQKTVLMLQKKQYQHGVDDVHGERELPSRHDAPRTR